MHENVPGLGEEGSEVMQLLRYNVTMKEDEHSEPAELGPRLTVQQKLEEYDYVFDSLEYNTTKDQSKPQ